MKEIGTETKKSELKIKQNLNFMAIDELYYKLKAQQKLMRCKSANIQNNNKRKINENLKSNKSFLPIDILNKGKNNSIELPLFSPKSSTYLDKKYRTINLKLNNSKGMDSTKQSTKRIFSGKSNSNYTIINNRTKIIDNKKKNKSNKKTLSIININADIEKYYSINSKNMTL